MLKLRMLYHVVQIGNGIAGEQAGAQGGGTAPALCVERRHLAHEYEREAFAEGIAPNGFLVCSDENGRFEVNSGEVSVRGLMDYI